MSSYGTHLRALCFVTVYGLFYCKISHPNPSTMLELSTLFIVAIINCIIPHSFPLKQVNIMRSLIIYFLKPQTRFYDIILRSKHVDKLKMSPAIRLYSRYL